MKKLLLIAFLIASGSLFAQNLQTHYDMGKNRGYLTTTLEMFKPDKMGNTFFFLDLNYGVGEVKGVSSAYFEIARVFKTKKMPFGIHVEYDGGFGQFKAGDSFSAFQINDAWLTGIDYSMNAADFSSGLTLKALFKYIQGKHNASFQLTAVWYVNFADNKMTFKGFADFWREDSDFNFDGNADSKYIFLSEPQLWAHLNDHFSLGGEVEISNNFGGMEGFYINPTLGLKWTF